MIFESPQGGLCPLPATLIEETLERVSFLLRSVAASSYVFGIPARGTVSTPRYLENPSFGRIFHSKWFEYHRPYTSFRGASQGMISTPRYLE